MQTVIYITRWPGLDTRKLEKLPLAEKQKMQVQLMQKINASEPWKHHNSSNICKYVSMYICV